MNGKLKVFPIPDASKIQALRLIHHDGPTLVVLDSRPDGSRQFVVAPVRDAHQPPVISNVSPSRSAAWDVTRVSDGSLSFVFAIPESASMWLSCVNSKRADAKIVVSRRYSRGYFGGAHFVKGDNKEMPISSVASVEGTARLVLFTREADGGYGEYRVVPTAGEGSLADARLIRYGTGYLLFAKFLTGSSIGERYPGVLYVSKLDNEFHQTQAAERCLNDRTIFDFDADVAGDRLAIFATTENGYLVATGQPGAPLHVRESSSPGILSSAGLAMEGKTVHVAAVEDAGTPKAKVVTGVIEND